MIGATTMNGILGQQTKISMQFIINVEAGESFTIPHLSGYNYDYKVKYGDGQIAEVKSYDDPNTSHFYEDAGAYTLSITGVCESFYFNFDGDCLKLTDVLSLGDLVFESLRFGGCENMLNFNAGKNVNVLNVDIQSMFNGCVSMVNCDISNANFVNASNLQWTWYNCNAMTDLKLGVNTFSNVEYRIYQTWQNCFALSNLEMPNVTLNNLTYIQGAFSNCNSLTSLDLSKWDLSNVTYINGLASSMNGLVSIDLGLNTFENCTTLQSLIALCPLLQSVNTTNCNFNKVKIAQWTFRELPLVQTIDISSFNPNVLTRVYGMFDRCFAITDVAPDWWNYPNITSSTYCFRGNTLRPNYSDIPTGWK